MTDGRLDAENGGEGRRVGIVVDGEVHSFVALQLQGRVLHCRVGGVIGIAVAAPKHSLVEGRRSEAQDVGFPDLQRVPPNLVGRVKIQLEGFVVVVLGRNFFLSDRLLLDARKRDHCLRGLVDELEQAGSESVGEVEIPSFAKAAAEEDDGSRGL